MLPGSGFSARENRETSASERLKVEMIEREVGPVNRTLLSAVISLQGAAL